MATTMEGSDSQKFRQIHSKQTEFLYDRLTVGLTATSVNSVVLTVVLWSRVPQRVLITWFVCTALVVLLRYVLLLEFRRHSSKPVEKYTDWGRLFLIGTAMSGICWGSVGIFLFEVDSITIQTFLAFVLGGMTAVAATAYSPRITVFLSFALPALIPTIIRLFAQGGDIHIAMGGMGLVFLILMVDSARRMNKTTLNALVLETENQELIGHLTAETRLTRKLNADLRSEIAEREKVQEELREARDSLERRVQGRTAELREALENVRVLRGLLPICSRCKKIRDEQGFWIQLEVFIRDHSEADFTHSLCPSCAAQMYPGHAKGTH
jgi:hypothetical protein